MLEQLIGLVKQFSGDSIINNPQIPNERNNEAMAEATNSIASGLQNAIAGGGLQNVLGLLGNRGGGGGGLMSNPIVQSIIGMFTSKLLRRFSLSPQAASGISSSLIPNVLSGLINKANDPNDNSIDLNGILGGLTGGGGQSGGGFNIGDLLNQFTGQQQEQQSQQGGGGLADIISQFTGGAQEQIANQSKQGGLFNMITNLLGK
jgi:hypothetical protein